MAIMSKPKAGAYDVRFTSGLGHAVYNPRGERVTPWYVKARDAQQRCAALQAAADRKAKRGPRPCLCCGTVFQSEGIHNRLCDPCRGRENEPARKRPDNAARVAA